MSAGAGGGADGAGGRVVMVGRLVEMFAWLEPGCLDADTPIANMVTPHK